jgi:hypothetical protein
VSALGWIWAVAVALAGGAVLWMSALIVLRVVHHRREARRLQDRRQLERAFVSILQDGVDSSRALIPYAHRARLMAEALLDFLSLVRGRDRDVVLSALMTLNVPRTLRKRLAVGSLAGRRVCLEALAAFPGDDTTQALRAVAETGPPEMRLTALRSLHETRGGVSFDQLLLQLRMGALPTSPLVGEFLRALVAEDPNSAAATLSALSLAPAVEVLLLDALGSAGEYAVLPVLMERAAAPAAEVRAAAVAALGALNHPAAEPTIRAALEDAEWPVRAAAAQAVGDIGLARLADALASRLEDPVWRVRFLAAGALAKLGSEGRRSLEQALVSPLSLVSETAALALAEQGLAT